MQSINEKLISCVDFVIKEVIYLITVYPKNKKTMANVNTPQKSFAGYLDVSEKTVES